MSPAEFPELYYYGGIFGALLYLTAYGFLQAGFIGGNSYTYALMNMFAAMLVAFSLALDFNLAALIIQISFIAISIFGITRLFVMGRRERFSAEERKLWQAKLGALSPIAARRFLSAGVWQSLEAGTVITTEGQPVARLTYLAEGQADVSLKGAHLAQIAPGGFIGEIGALTGAHATATVIAANRLRVFSIDTPALERLCQSDDEIRLTLFASIGAELGAKLSNSNKKILESSLSP